MSITDFDGKTREFPPVNPDDCYPARAPALNFVDAVCGNAPNGSPGELGLASMEVIEAACQSAHGAGNVIIRPIS
jgi:predicted dehydrogenase